MDVFTLNNSNDPSLYLNFFAEQISWGAIKLSRFENGDTRYGKQMGTFPVREKAVVEPIEL